MFKSRACFTSTLIVMLFFTSSENAQAKGTGKDAAYLSSTTTAVSAAIFEPIGFSLSYTFFGFVWTTSPGQPKTNDLHTARRVNFIHRNQRPLVEDIAVGGGPVLSEVLFFYFQEKQKHAQMLRFLRKNRKMYLEQLKKGDVKSAEAFEHACKRLASQIHTGQP